MNIYCFTTETYKKQGLYKVGQSKRSIENRLADLQSNHPDTIELVAKYEGLDLKVTDYMIHRQLLKRNIERVHGEWFRFNSDPTKILNEIVSAIDYLAITEPPITQRIKPTISIETRPPNTGIRTDRYGRQKLVFGYQVPCDLRLVYGKSKITHSLGELSDETIKKAQDLNVHYSTFFKSLRNQVGYKASYE